MSPRQRWGWLAAATLFLAMIVGPYLAAVRLAGPGVEFTGFLVNPVDGFSYLAKMRQGWEGGWLFHLSYTESPGAPALLFPYHLGLGHLARTLGGSLLTTYHAARLAGAAAMLWMAIRFFRRASLSNGGVGWAMAFVLFGAGWGWLASPFHVLAADLVMPESLPWYSAYANSHFALACAALLAVSSTFLRPARSHLANMGVGLLAGALLGAVAGYAAVPLGLAMGVWWLAFRKRFPQESIGRGATGVAFLAGSVPWLIYDWILSRSHPVLSLWFEQNQTPSPPPYAYLLAYGPVLLLAGLAFLRGRKNLTPAAWFLLIWTVILAASLYAPFELQRRFALGMFFPLVGLAASSLEAMPNPRRRWIGTLALLSGAPSILLVVAAGLAAVQQNQPGLVIDSNVVQALRGLPAIVERGSVVLAGPQTGNEIPAFADVLVVYGHPFETPRASESREIAEGLYRGQIDLTEFLAQGHRVDWVFYGPEERGLGDPPWRASLPISYEDGGILIYRVPAP